MKIRCVVQVLSIDNTCVANKTLHFQCALAQDGTLTQLELLAMSVAMLFYIARFIVHKLSVLNAED